MVIFSLLIKLLQNYEKYLSFGIKSGLLEFFLSKKSFFLDFCLFFKYFPLYLRQNLITNILSFT